MGTSLNGLTPAGTYPGLIKTGDNAPIDGTLKTLSDGNGNNLPMAVSTTAVNFTNQLQQSGVAVPTASQVAAKQDTLVSGTNIKTINSTSLLGSGNIDVVTSPSGVAGAIQFSNGSAFASDAANLFWDDTNNRLGVGTNAPTRQIEAFASNPEIATRIATNGTAKFSFLLSTGTELAAVSLIGSTGEMRFRAGSGGYFQTFYSQDVEAMRIDLNQNINIGATALGARLGIKGSGSTSATTSLLVQNSAGVSSLQVKDDGTVFNLGKGAVSGNLAFGENALINNGTANGNTAIGSTVMQNNTTGIFNTGLGNGTLVLNTSGSYNTGLGAEAGTYCTTNSYNTAVGYAAIKTNTAASNTAVGAETVSGNFAGSVILGRGATATASNQFVVGSTGTNAGAVTTESNSSSKVWNVIINGVAQKILLA